MPWFIEETRFYKWMDGKWGWISLSLYLISLLAIPLGFFWEEISPNPIPYWMELGVILSFVWLIFGTMWEGLHWD